MEHAKWNPYDNIQYDGDVSDNESWLTPLLPGRTVRSSLFISIIQAGSERV